MAVGGVLLVDSESATSGSGLGSDMGHMVFHKVNFEAEIPLFCVLVVKEVQIGHFPPHLALTKANQVVITMYIIGILKHWLTNANTMGNSNSPQGR